ncbi:MAG: response regulator [Nanoarchaeota archaeon]|nr:response regulator [Nanoarchaeota archaeon]
MEGKKKIVFAEDELLQRVCISDLLHGLGYVVYVFDNGKEAFEMIPKINERSGLDLLITDNMMPGMRGREIIMALNQEGYTFPILVVSTNDITKHVKYGGRLEFLQKPYSSDDIQEKVEGLIGKP